MKYKKPLLNARITAVAILAGLCMFAISPLASAAVIGPDSSGSANTGSTNTSKSNQIDGRQPTCPTSGTLSKDQQDQGCTQPVGDSAANASCSTNACDLVGKYLNPAIKLLSAVVGIIVVISIILGGIQYSTSAGDPQKAAKAKNRIFMTIFALIAYAFLFAFLQFLIPGGIH